MAKALFLDRDGTLNEDYDFVHRKEEWTWCKGAIETIQWANEQGFKVIVVTNQSGVARGLFTLKQVRELHDWVNMTLKAHGAYIDEWCVAHWHPVYSKSVTEKELSYRKPGLGYYLEMIEKYGLNAKQCYCIGDKSSDLQPAVELGMNGFYIKSRFHEKNDQQWLQRHGFVPHENLSEVLLKLKESGER